jgi:D-3-phosphoglycerate dehydrogenase
MKLVGIYDLFIKKEYFELGLQPLQQFGIEINTVEWKVGEIGKFQEINLKVEKEGSEAIEPTQEVMDAIRDADIIVTHFCTITKNVIDHCKNLKMVCVLRGGVENVNVDYATKNDILCVNTPGRTANAVADFTIAMVLAEVRNIARAYSCLKEGKWVRDFSNKDHVYNLFDKTFGIIGLGEIGRKVAQRLSGFETRLLGYDPFVSQADVEALGVRLVSLDELMAQSDMITMNARLTKETFHMVGAHEISLMKPTAYIVNTARSGLIDEAALYEALKAKKIMGAALDVFDEEPTPLNYPLTSLDNVTITPHLAGGTVNTMTDSPKLLARNLVPMFATGKAPRGALNYKEIHLKL